MTLTELYEAERSAYTVLVDTALDLARLVTKHGPRHPFYRTYKAAYTQARTAWEQARDALAIERATDVSLVAVHTALKDGA